MSSVLIAILAAGESRRMGRTKLCLPWGHTTILGHIINRWNEAGALDILVIHPRGPETPVALELDRLGLPAHQRAETVAPEKGMMGSVITAARLALHLRGLTHLIVALGDQPQVHASTLQSLLAACATSPGRIVRPVFAGKPGHPVALPASLVPELSRTSCATLRDFLSSQKVPVTDLTCPDSGILLDIDTPQEYDHAQRTAHLPKI